MGQMISIGMTKEEVIKKLGRSDHATADGQSEVPSHIRERPWRQGKPFQVKLVDGKVASY